MAHLIDGIYNSAADISAPDLDRTDMVNHNAIYQSKTDNEQYNTHNYSKGSE